MKNKSCVACEELGFTCAHCKQAETNDCVWHERFKALEAKCARQAELLERAGSFARHVSACTDHSDTPFSDLAEEWLSDYASLSGKAGE